MANQRSRSKTIRHRNVKIVYKTYDDNHYYIRNGIVCNGPPSPELYAMGIGSKQTIGNIEHPNINYERPKEDLNGTIYVPIAPKFYLRKAEHNLNEAKILQTEVEDLKKFQEPEESLKEINIFKAEPKVNKEDVYICDDDLIMALDFQDEFTSENPITELEAFPRSSSPKPKEEREFLSEYYFREFEDNKNLGASYLRFKQGLNQLFREYRIRGTKQQIQKTIINGNFGNSKDCTCRICFKKNKGMLDLFYR